jgi:hypothetical protein
MFSFIILNFSENAIFIIILVAIAKYCIEVTFAVSYDLSSELFHTKAKASVMSS